MDSHSLKTRLWTIQIQETFKEPCLLVSGCLWSTQDRGVWGSVSGLDACLLVTGHQRCSKRWVVRGEGKFRSMGGSEIG